MYSWVKLGHIADWCEGVPRGSLPRQLPITMISTDSRTLKPGEVFLALRGKSFDGHQFIPEALKKGAAAVISEQDAALACPHVTVKSSLSALVRIGERLREHFRGTVMAITGSAGKSTTKDMVATLIGPTTVSSPASFNNLIGVSKTLFLVNESTEHLVLEMGMNAPLEIKELCEHFKPEMGLITNIGEAHIGKLGGKEKIYEAKKELFDYLATSVSQKLAVALNVEDTLVKKAYEQSFRRKIRTMSYSAFGASADVMITEKKIHPENGHLYLQISVKGELIEYDFPLFGLHHAQNLSAAIAMASLVGVPLSQLVTRFPKIRPAYHRGEIHATRSGGLLIDESYNSNPPALSSSLSSLADINPAKRRVLILGEMRELGDFSASLHRKVASHLVKVFGEKKIPFVLLAVGPDAIHFIEPLKPTLSPQSCYHVKDVHEAISLASTLLQPGDLVFVKGSRGVQLDLLVSELKITL